MKSSDIQRMLAKKDLKGLLSCLNHQKSHVQKKALVAIASLGDNSAIQPLLDKLQEQKFHLKAEVARVLAQLYDSLEMQPLIDEITEKGNGASRSTKQNLAKIWSTEDKRGVKVLVNLIERTHNFSFLKVIADIFNRVDWKPDKVTSKANLLLLAAKNEWEEIIQIGIPALEVLRNIVDFGDEDASANAKYALKHIGDPIVQAVLTGERHLSRGLVKTLGVLGDLRLAEKILDWIFLPPFYIYSEIDLEDWHIALQPLFRDYCELILKAAMYAQKSAEYDYSTSATTRDRFYYDTNESDEAVKQLLEIKTQISTNLLHKIAHKPDFPVEVAYKETEEDKALEYGHLDFTEQREQAKTELHARNNSSYTPEAFLHEDEWYLP